MKVKVISDNCIGCGACEAIAPDLFELKDGVSHAFKEDVPENLEDNATEAIESCPTEAIKEIK